MQCTNAFEATHSAPSENSNFYFDVRNTETHNFKNNCALKWIMKILQNAT